MSFVGSLLNVGGGVVEGMGYMKSAKAEQQLGEYNAQILEDKIKTQQQSQILLESQKKRILKSRVGSQVAGYAKSGLRFTGSVLNVVQDSLENAYLDMAIDKYNSDVTAIGYQNQANVTRYEAQQRSSLLRAQGTATYIRTAGDFIRDISNSAQKAATAGAL